MIQSKRGIKSTLPSAKSGEILITTDTNEMFFSGDGTTQKQIATTDLLGNVGKILGEPFLILGNYQAPSSSFPSLCISKISSAYNTILSTAHYPLLVPFLRGISYVENQSSYGNTFTCTISGSVITFANNTQNNNMLLALAEEGQYDNSVQGGTVDTINYTNWAMTINVAGVDYTITAINTATRAATVSGTPSSSATSATIYPYRVAGSTTTAIFRLLKDDSVLKSGLGFRSRGKFQGHNATIGLLNHGNAYGTGSTAPPAPWVNDGNTGLSLVTDGTNGTPRTGSDTQSHGLQALIYLYASTYTP